MTTEPLPPNIGGVYVGAFRWVLLLLLALVMEKAAEGISVKARVGSTEAPAVYSPLVSGFDTTADVHYGYLMGFFQMGLTLMFGVRYFVCLVDPIERWCGLNADSDGENALVAALKSVGGRELVVVSFIALPEFVLLLHAATSVASSYQWLHFLLLFVIWDTVAFAALINMPTLVTKALGRGRIEWDYACTIASIWLEVVNTKRSAKVARESNERTAKSVWKEFGPGAHRWMQEKQQQITDSTAARQTKLDERKAQAKQNRPQMANLIKGLAGDYGPWNAIDLATLTLGLVGIYLHGFGKDAPDVVGALTRVAPLGILSSLLFFLGLYNMKKEQRLNAVLALLLLLLSTGVLYLAQMKWDRSTQHTLDDCRFEAALALILFSASSLFGFLNFRGQKTLWYLHLRVLSLPGKP